MTLKKPTEWYVEIIEHGPMLSRKVIKTIGPCTTARNALKVQRGAEINLDQTRFTTRVVQK